jgi:Ran-binding protein 9/10
LRCRRFVELILEACEAKRRISRDADTSVTDAAGSGAVAAEGANAMDLDNEEDFPLSPASHASPWSVNGGAIGIPITSPTTKSKGKQTARRRSSASRPSGSLVRASSRTRGGTGSLISPMAPSVSREETSEVAEYMQRLLDYGTSLSKDWEGDERVFVREHLRKTVGLVAYEDPYLNSRSKELVSPEARLELAEEVNKAILGKSSLL